MLIWFSGFGRQSKNGARNLFLWIGALAVASLTGFIYLYQSNQPAAYFLMPSRFWEMAVGCLVFIGFQKRAKIEQALEQVPPLLVVTVIVGVMFLPVASAVPATISIVVLSAILIACLKNGSAAFAVFTNSRVVYVGLISYSLYLWHWGVLSISRWSIGIHWWSAPFQFLLMAVLATFSYELVEKRFRGATLTRPLSVIGFGVITLIAAALLVKFSGSQKDHMFLSGLYDIRQSEPFAVVKGKPFDPTCVVDGQKRLLLPKTFDDCTIQPANKNLPSVWVFGDSHAGHLSGMLDAMHKRQGIGYHLVETPGIPFPQTSQDIFEYRQVIFREARKRMKRGDVVLLARLYIDRVTNNTVADFDRWIAKVSDFARVMNRQGVGVAVMQPTPFFSADSASCNSSLLSRLNDVCRQGISEYSRIFESVNTRLKSISENNKSVILVNPFKALCTAGANSYCPRNVGISAMYRDGDHLNSTGSSMLSELTLKTLFGKAPIE